MAPEDPVENAGEMSRMVEEPPAHHHARRVHADHSLQQENHFFLLYFGDFSSWLSPSLTFTLAKYMVLRWSNR